MRKDEKSKRMRKDVCGVPTAPKHNVGKDAYIVDLESDEKLYCLGTESGLLGDFGFKGVCTVGDGSCDPPTKSMGEGFCNFNTIKWNTTAPLTHGTPTGAMTSRIQQSGQRRGRPQLESTGASSGRFGKVEPF